MLRKLIRKGELLVCPGVYDGISLRIAQKVGFDAHYMTGYGTVASHLGLPDAGLAGYGACLSSYTVEHSSAAAKQHAQRNRTDSTAARKAQQHTGTAA